MKKPKFKVCLHSCKYCGRGIGGNVSDPVITARTLGTGFYHERCAKEIWTGQRHEAGREEREKYEHKADAGLRAWLMTQRITWVLRAP